MSLPWLPSLSEMEHIFFIFAAVVGAGDIVLGSLGLRISVGFHRSAAASLSLLAINSSRFVLRIMS